MQLLLALFLFLVAVASTLAEAAGFDISFYGNSPIFPSGSKMNIVAGVNPGVPVVFDSSEPKSVVLRPATRDETSSDAQPIFLFEWQKDKSARFYRIYPPSVLSELSTQNSIDTATSEGKEFEQKSLFQFLQQGKVLNTCLAENPIFNENITIFIVIGATGKLEKAFVQPEGSVAECVLETTKEAMFDSPPTARPFTSKANIRVAE